jgi:glycosyltransferase involved in cell wall biosynthesis
MVARRVMMVLPYPLDPSEGGVQRSTLQMGEFLAKEGWSVCYVSLWKSDPVDQVSVDCISPGAEHDVSTDAGLTKFLKGAIESHQPEVVFNQVGLPRQPALALDRLRTGGLRFKIISCFRNSPAFYSENVGHSGFVERYLGQSIGWIPGVALLNRVAVEIHRWRTARLFQKAMDRCDLLMLLAPSYIENLRWYLPNLDVSKILIMPNAYVQPESVDFEEKKNWILYVGRIEEAQKGVLMLPKLWNLLQDRLSDWELHIVGDGPDKTSLLKSFEEMNAQRVFVHNRQRADHFFEQARMFVMTSRYEGFANTLIEAQMHGTVPIAFRSFSAINWMVNDRRDSILIPPYDLEEMVCQILRVARNNNEREQLALEGVKNAERFSEERIGERWLAILNELLAEGSDNFSLDLLHLRS